MSGEFLQELFHIFHFVSCSCIAVIIIHEDGDFLIREPCALVLIQILQVRATDIFLATAAAFLNAVSANIWGRTHIDNTSEGGTHILDVVVPHLIESPFHGIHHSVVFQHLGEDMVVRLQAPLRDEDTGADAAAGTPGLNLLLDIDCAAQEGAVLEGITIALNVLVEDLKEVLARLVLECLPCTDGFINEVPVRMAFFEGVDEGTLAGADRPF